MRHVLYEGNTLSGIRPPK